MGKRANGEGSVYKRKSDGLFCATLWVDGKRKVYADKTRKAAIQKRDAAKRALDAGLPVTPERQTVGQFLEQWLQTIEAAQHVRARTFDSYRYVVRLHIVPAIGHIKLSKLHPQHVQSLITTKSKAGLSARTVQYIRAVLRMALAQAVEWQLIARNAATQVDVPRSVTPKRGHLTAEQALQLLDAAASDRLQALYATALLLGLRQSELLGLRWSDVDLQAGTLTVNQTLQRGSMRDPVFDEPKTEKSRRTLPLPASLVQLLRQQHVHHLEDRVRAGADWQDFDLVFATTVGTPISHRNLQRAWKQLLARAGLPDVRFHDLRHTCASLLAHLQVPAHIAMKILGHSSITITLDVYTHALDSDKQAAVETLDRLLNPKKDAS